jgi:hypothetical protein
MFNCVNTSGTSRDAMARSVEPGRCTSTMDPGSGAVGAQTRTSTSCSGRRRGILVPASWRFRTYGWMPKQARERRSPSLFRMSAWLVNALVPRGTGSQLHLSAQPQASQVLILGDAPNPCIQATGPRGYFQPLPCFSSRGNAPEAESLGGRRCAWRQPQPLLCGDSSAA